MKRKNESVKVMTPVGILSFPALDKPDAQGRYDKDKYKASLMIPKEAMKTPQGKKFAKTILTVGRKHFGDKKLTMKDFTHPLIDGDEKNPEYNAHHYVIIAKNKRQPTLIGPDKTPLTSEQISKLKDGDHVRFVVGVFGHDHNGGGVSLGLDLVQFSHEGEALGGGRTAALELVDELEVELEEPDEEAEDDDEVEDDEEDNDDDGVII